MILENLKNKLKNTRSEDILRILLGFVFLTAGVFRIFNPSAAVEEIKLLNLSNLLAWPIIILEVAGGLALIFKKYFRIITVVFVIFLLLTLVNAIYLDRANIFHGVSELFVFNLNLTDFFLHFVFLVVLISFLIRKK